MPTQDVADGGAAGERLVNLHGCSSGVCEYPSDALALQGLDQDVGPLPRLAAVSVFPLSWA